MTEHLSHMESERDVARLTEATIGLLLGSVEDDALADVESIPPAVILREIVKAAESLGCTVEEATQLANVVSRQELAPDIAKAVVAELGRNESLGQEIADSFERRSELMVVDPLTISAAALLLLVLRVRRVKLSKDGLDVRLDPLKGDVVKVVLNFLGGGS